MGEAFIPAVLILMAISVALAVANNIVLHRRYRWMETSYRDLIEAKSGLIQAFSDLNESQTRHIVELEHLASLREQHIKVLQRRLDS